MNNKIRLEILTLTASILLILFVYASPGEARLSQTVPMKLETPAVEQRGDPSTSEPVVLTDEQEKYSLGLHLEVLEDPSGELTIEDVSSTKFDIQFAPSEDEVPNYGFTNSVYWARLRLDNETLQTIEWLLEVNFANMHYVDLYTPLPDGEGFTVKQTGTVRPVSTRDIPYPNIVFNLSVPTQSLRTYYLRFQNGASMTLGLTLWTKDAFWIQAQQKLILHWLFYGVLIGLLVYNLFLLFSLKEANYLYFVFELAATILLVLSYDGYMQIYIIPNLYSFSQFYIPTSFALLFISIFLFTDTFLEIKTQLPKLHWTNIVIVGVWGVLMVWSLFTSYHFIANLMTPLALLSLVVALVAGITSLRRGFRPSRFYIIAWSGLFVTLSIIILVRLGIISVTILSENLFRLGMIWLGVCWSFALADRINLLKAETESANRGLQNSENRLSQILEGLPVGVALYGKDQKPVYINQRTADLLSNPVKGIRPDYSVRRTLGNAIKYYSLQLAGSGKEYPIENFPIFKALQGEPASADDIEMDQGDRRVPLEFWASPIMNDAGNVESAVATIQDISQRKQAEAELVEYRNQLELLVEKRTTELNTTNKELRQRLEWMSAIVLVTESMARLSDFTQIYEKIIEIINRLFAVQDSFIAEFDQIKKHLKILAHSCHSEPPPDLIGSLMTLPEGILPDSNLEQGKLVFVSRDQLNSMSGPIGSPYGHYIQDSRIQSIVLVPLQLREQVFGFLCLEMLEEGRIFTKGESSLLSVFSTDIAQLIQDSGLFEHAKALIMTEERNRLARELHDSVTQTLFTASVLAEVTPRIWEKDKGIAHQNMDKLSLLIRGALAEMRSMLIELRSEDLLNQTLDQLLITLVEGARARSTTVITTSIPDVPELPKNVTLAFYRIAREALNNAIIHAAAAQIDVSLLAETGQLELRIRDDGCGFDPRAVSTGHLGINIMHERAAGIGGEMQILSKPGQGTDIVITWSSKGGESVEVEYE